MAHWEGEAVRASFLTIAASAVLAGGAVAYYLLWEPHGGEVRQDIVQETDFLSANPKYLEGVQSYITNSGLSCPQIVHLWAIGNSLLGPKLEAFCDSKDPNALHYAVYPDDHDAVAWSNADDFETRLAAIKNNEIKNNEWAAKNRALEERNKLQRQLCQMASACERYNQARLDCATAGDLKSCILIKMGDYSSYADSCSSGEIGTTGLPPSPDTPNAWVCFWLKHPRTGAILDPGHIAAGPTAAPSPPTSGPNGNTELVPRYGMQLTANWSESEAWATYRLIQKQYAALIGDREPIVILSRGIGLGSAMRYNIRIADDDRTYLEKLCNKLIAAGGACVVLRNDRE
jgi:hypothetical protein